MIAFSVDYSNNRLLLECIKLKITEIYEDTKTAVAKRSIKYMRIPKQL